MQLYGDPVTTTAYKVTRTMIGVECDVCEKVIKKGRYFEVTTGHHDWGLESPESRETLDICPDCVGKYISDYLKDCSDTGYLEVTTEDAWGQKKHDILDYPPKEDDVIKVDHDGFY